MEIISKISKGSKMNQIYIPKNRFGFETGSYVIIKPLEEKKPIENLFFYGIKEIEPIKIEIIKEVIKIIDNNIKEYQNIIFTGSFLDKGFTFNDLDLIIIINDAINDSLIKDSIYKKLGIKGDILSLSNNSLSWGLEIDPLYQIMLSKSISKNRIFYKTKNNLNYKLLDLHLLKSKVLIDNFDILSGNEKYTLVRNMMAIYLYLEGKKLTKDLVDNEIKEDFHLKDINDLKQNLIDKKKFIAKYKLIYSKTFSKILKGIENDSKQKQAN